MNIFSGSNEFALASILDNVEHIKDLHFDLNRILIEIQYSNDLKEFELGVISNDEFFRRRNEYNHACEQINNERYK